MPIYEYKCTKCEMKFEELVKSGTKVKCPQCKAEAKKLFSTFGFSSSGKTSTSSSCGTCSSTNCGTCAS